MQPKYKVDTAKRLFFDTKAIRKATTRAERRVLSKFGAEVRQVAQSRIKRVANKRINSTPGKSPFGHGDQLLRKLIYFFYDAKRRSVLIAPAQLNRSTGAPGRLEQGGVYRSKSKFLKKGEPRQIKIAKRPYMQPSFDKLLPSVPKRWKDSIKP